MTEKLPYPIKLSPSALNNYDACKRKFYYSRTLYRDDGEEPIYFTRGSEAHAVMDGSKELEDISKEARLMAKKLIKLRDGLGYQIKHHELTQKWSPVENVIYERRIDGLGYDKDGFGVIIDWKTASRAWKTFGNVAPQALTWQTPGYFIPPPQEMLDEIGWTDPWPRQMAYIIGPTYGRGQVFTVEYDADIVADLYKLFGDIMIDNDHHGFPKTPGYGCGMCSFADRCWEVPGWEDLYKARRLDK